MKSLVPSVLAILGLAAMVGCGAGCGGPNALMGKNEKDPFGQHPMLSDNRSVLQKGYDRVVALFAPSADAERLAQAKAAAQAAKRNDPTALSKPSKPGPDFWVTLAQVAERSGNVRGAAAHYERALQLEPGHDGALLGFARMHDRQGNFGEAERLYEQAIKRHPQSATAHNDFGLCMVRQGNTARGIALLTKAVELQPGKALYRNNLGTVLVQAGREQEAWRHLAAVHPPAVAHYNMGFLLRHHGQLASARKHFAAAVQRDPKLAVAQQSLAELDGQVQAMAHAGTAAGAGAIPAAAVQPQGHPRYGNPHAPVK